ncbi:hypothetical protein RW092_12480, partial [Paenibacillus sp. 3LSP]|uniref:hypothetical protein n=1 Tax=Paenibacillus sp. 3LSP TaxID=2800795 RepID=UPI0028FD5137
SGWFFVSHASRAQLAKAIIKKAVLKTARLHRYTDNGSYLDELQDALVCVLNYFIDRNQRTEKYMHAYNSSGTFCTLCNRLYEITS